MVAFVPAFMDFCHEGGMAGLRPNLGRSGLDRYFSKADVYRFQIFVVIADWWL